MFWFGESSEKRLNSVRSKFADASIWRLIEDWGRSAASEALQRHLSIDIQNQDIIGKIFACSKRLMFCFCKSNEKRLNSVRSADAPISRLKEDRGRSEVQPSYRLPKVRETCAAVEILTWRKYETKCRSWNRFFFFFFYFHVVKARKISSFACVV